MGSGSAAGVLIGLGLGLAVGPLWAGCTPDSLELRGPGGVARLHVDVADTTEERARGLMFRPSMPKSAGMLFVYDHPQAVSFWMKNTLIPLDMIFADASGRVSHVHPDAVPGDETPIPGGDAVQFVLEINAGMAERLGLGPGSELRHPAIPADQAAWPCD